MIMGLKFLSKFAGKELGEAEAKIAPSLHDGWRITAPPTVDI